MPKCSTYPLYTHSLQTDDRVSQRVLYLADETAAQKRYNTPWAIKTYQLTCVHIFAKYWPMLKILPLTHSVEN